MSDMAMKYAMKKRMAKGGKVPTIEIKPHPPEIAELSKEQVDDARKRFAEKPSGKPAEHDPFADYGHGYVPKKKMAEGGLVDDEHEQDADMIARIMHKRKMYSEGGKVANDVGVAEADKMPAEYDDLVLRDDLESSYDGENSGDMDGSKLNQDEGDMISRIMKKRKQTNPRPA